MTQVDSTEMIERLFDSGVHVERALHIETMLATPSDDLEEAIRDGRSGRTPGRDRLATVLFDGQSEADRSSIGPDSSTTETP